MIDEEKARSGGFEPPMDTGPDTGLDLTLFSHAELRALRREIDRILPDLAGMDLQKELTDQYNTVKDYQDGLLSDAHDEDERRGVEPNKMASVLNATTATLEKLIKMQESLDRAETLKKMEACLIESLRLLPDEARDTFFAEYEALATRRGLQ